MSNRRKYNFIYTKLVLDKSDMIGHIAYSLYKADKISWITEYKKNNKGKDPTETEFDKYHKSCCTDGRIQQYKSLALQLLQNFIVVSYEEMTDNVASEVSNEVSNRIEEKIKRKWWREYLHGMAQSALGTLALSLIIGLIILLSKYSLNDFWRFLLQALENNQ